MVTPINTEIKFTGQRLDAGVDLYCYGARYYDAGIGRFISADSIVPRPNNPQFLNRYSYVVNNPLRYIDPSGMVSVSAPKDPGQNIISEPPWFTGPGETTTSTSTSTAQTPSGPVTITKETSTATWPTTPAGTVTVTTSVTTVTTSSGTVTTIVQTTTDSEGETTGISPSPASVVQNAYQTSPQSAIYTFAGAVLGLYSGVAPFVGPNNTLIYENVPPSSLAGEWSVFLGARAFTVGHIVISPDLMDPQTLADEVFGHVDQYDRLGRDFLPIYIDLTKKYGVRDNPLEVEARKAAGEE